MKHQKAEPSLIRTGKTIQEKVKAMADDHAQQSGRTPHCFLGRRTLSKIYLMLHFGRMLTQHGTVRLDTVNRLISMETIYDHNGIEVHEYPDESQLQAALKESWHNTARGTASATATTAMGQTSAIVTADQDEETIHRSSPFYHLVDLEEAFPLPVDTDVLLVTDPDRNSMEKGFSLLSATGLLSERFRVHRIYLDVCEASRIGVRYLEGLLMRFLPPSASLGEWYALSMEENNQGAILDNQHEDMLRLGRLSSSYHALLKELAYSGYGISKALSTRCIRMADKPARKNRFVQTEVGR